MITTQIVRQASRALIGAVLAFCLLFQLVLGTAARSAHAANKAQGLDRLGILCSASEGRGTPDRTTPEEVHHTKDGSGCCPWGGRDAQFACHLLQPVAAFTGTYDAPARSIAFARNDIVEHPTPLALRRQAPRAPPALI
jgi:hypothetical protein